ncbi:MAG: tRNA pseudouridine(38-40) synthase TruA [Thermodesulfovibrionales bacterium]|nr:tRNA pseudouridine(38-40) synthase TruA [Thermodesulfovibrionales bacterium]
MRNIKGIIQYDGTGFKGWQIQKDAPTIQGTITRCLQILTKEPISVLASGRTDAGVHAIEQVISFLTTSDIQLNKLIKAMNALLPSQIRVLNISEAELNFNPRYDAKMKTYLYVIFNGHFVSPFINNFVWDFPIKLDIEEMIEASKYLIGTHDFSSFTCPDFDKDDFVREVYSIKVIKDNTISFMGFSLQGDFITIEITANGFLRHMVRNIVGTLVDVGRKRMTISRFNEILLSKDRRLAGCNAPARGLFLKKVYY